MFLLRLSFVAALTIPKIINAGIIKGKIPKIKDTGPETIPINRIKNIIDGIPLLFLIPIII